jgi:hypothetical protein
MAREDYPLDAIMEAVRDIEGLSDILGYAQVSAFSQRMWLETGDMKFVLMAIKDCAIYGEVIPEWAANAFCRAYRDVTYKRAGSWDDVFGRPIKKGERLENSRQRFELAPRVWFAIMEILEQEPETRIDNLLFERVGSQLDIVKGKSVVEELWSQCPLKALWHKHRVKSD